MALFLVVSVVLLALAVEEGETETAVVAVLAALAAAQGPATGAATVSLPSIATLTIYCSAVI